MSNRNRDDLGESLQRLPAEIRRLVEKRVELMGLELAEQFSGIFAAIFYRFQGIAILGAGCLLLVFALAFYLGGLLGSTSLGFVIASVPVLLVGFVLMSMKPKSWVRKARERIFAMMMKTVLRISGSDGRSKLESGNNGKE